MTCRINRIAYDPVEFRYSIDFIEADRKKLVISKKSIPEIIVGTSFVFAQSPFSHLELVKRKIVKEACPRDQKVEDNYDGDYQITGK
jgi:hypothetical protein